MTVTQVIVKRPDHKAEMMYLDEVLSEGVTASYSPPGLAVEPNFIPFAEGVKVYEYIPHVAVALKRIKEMKTEAAFLERLRLLYPPLAVEEPEDLVDEIGDNSIILTDGRELTYEELGRMLKELAVNPAATSLAASHPLMSAEMISNRLNVAASVFSQLATAKAAV